MSSLFLMIYNYLERRRNMMIKYVNLTWPTQAIWLFLLNRENVFSHNLYSFWDIFFLILFSISHANTSVISYIF